MGVEHPHSPRRAHHAPQKNDKMQNMKRIFIVAITALAVAGCSKEPPDDQGKGGTSDIVAFSTDGGTRGTPITDVSQLEDIGTFGYYTGQSVWTEASLPGLMFDQRLYRDGAEWKYDGVEPVEWPGVVVSDLFTFYAYSPYATAENGIVVQGDASTGGIPTLTYTVPTDVTKQPDLMVAVPRVDIVKPASGYVSLTMQHALTTIGFQVAGNGEQITGFSVSGVSMTGTLKMDGGNIVWTNLDTPPTADFSASINYDDGQSYYTATPAMSTDLMKGDGYLMMIPQELDDNAVLVVTYADGSTLEANIDPHEWLPGKKIVYELTIVPGGVIVVEPVDITMPWPASQSTMLVECSDNNGEPAPSMAWTLSSSEAWLTLSLDNDPSNASLTLSGTGTQTVYVFATENVTKADRTATVALNEAENIVTHVRQLYAHAQRFARSNIVMYDFGGGNKVLTFAETEADHTENKSVTYNDVSSGSAVNGSVPAIPANVQGLHFRWGSLVGVTSNGTNGTTFSSSHVVFWPAEHASQVPATWVFNANSNVVGQVPYATGSDIGSNPYPSNNPAIWTVDAFAGYPGGTGPGFDKANAKGDICRYISDMGWVAGRWRIPTSREIMDLMAETPIYGSNGKVMGTWDESYQQINGTGANGQYGYSRIPDVRIVGKGVAGGTESQSSLTNPGAAKVLFPAAGYRNGYDGVLFETGYYAHHWESTQASGGSAYDMDYNSTTNYYANNMFGRGNGFSVRCIME